MLCCMRPIKLVRIPARCNLKVSQCNVMLRWLDTPEIQKLQMTKKTLILYHRDELVIQSDIHNICDHVAVSRMFLLTFEYIRECLLFRCLCLCCLSELVVFFECLFFICHINV